jgi:hypothetical protein
MAKEQQHPRYVSPLGELFQAEEQKLRASLAEIRTSFSHPGDKGSHAEETFRSLLRRYLPLTLRVAQGEIIDRFGGRSKQTDVVVVDDDHPFTFEESKPGLFFIEGVIGAGEVKSVLTAQELAKAVDNSRAFKALQAWFNKGDTVAATPSDRARYLGRPPYFLFAFESSLSLESIRERLAAESGGSIATNLVDGVFVLDKGSMINYGDGQGGFKMMGPGGKPVVGWAGSNRDVLVTMLAWFSVVMLRVKRIQPILPAYLVKTWDGSLP